MATYSSLAIGNLRSYVWSILQSENLLSSSDYYADGFDSYLIPIIPAQQMPEFNNLLPGKTYLVYDYEVKKGRENWWISEEDMTISIISTSYDKINTILNCLFDYFRRFDDSANDLQEYLNTNQLNDFNFHLLYVDSIISPEPFDKEGNFQVGQIKICYGYSRDLNSSGRFK
jgi:hypothetical protein